MNKKKRIIMMLLLVCTVTVTVSAASTYKTYTVSSGDTLSTIAQGFQMTLEDILNLNPEYKTHQDRISIGDKLIVTVSKEIYFEDVNFETTSHEYKSISYVVENDIMQGIDKLHFGVNESLTRAQLATILYRMAGEPSSNITYFRDVQTNQWFTSAICYVANSELMTGIGNSYFDPYGIVTIEQLATILWRAEGYPSFNSCNIPNNCSSWAIKAMMWGQENTKIFEKSPKKAATRLDVAEALYDIKSK